MSRTPRLYELTPAIIAASVGTGVMCLSASGLGRSYRLHAERPDARLNQRLTRADVPAGSAIIGAGGPVEAKPSVILVRIDGGLEQRAGYHDPCEGWSDGHDAVAERLCAAFEEGDVLLVIDSPGGAAAGMQQAAETALRAKKAFGRRVTVYADEQIGSAAMWWAAALGDEIFIPPMGEIGSVGARAGHMDISGKMAKEGLKYTYFADPPGKVALAPEEPLSPLGAARGNRDVKLCADAFRAAVCAGPVGVRYGLTPEILIDLGADMLTGQAAVDAGLCDGVATLTEVTAYALKLAESGGEDTSTSARAQKGRTKMRLEGDDNPKERTEDDPPPSDKGRDIPTKCGGCAVENDKDAKYCKGCGASMATTALEEPDDPPPSSKKPGATAAASARLPARVSTDANVLEILGIPAGASLPAQKTEALDLRQLRDMCARMTGQTSTAGIIGAMTVVEQNAAASIRLRRERDDVRREQSRAERWSLAQRLVALNIPGRQRGDVLVDVVTDDGKRVEDKDGRPLQRLTAEYAEMRLPTLRGIVEGHEKTAKPRDPFVSDPTKAAEAARTGAQGDTASRIAAMKESPVALRMFRDPSNTRTIDEIAEALVRNMDALAGAGGAA